MSTDEVNELSIVWPADYHPSEGQVDPLGLREFRVATPFGDAALQYWLCRRRGDGGPHAEFVREVIAALPREQRLWLGTRKGKALVDQRLLEEVRAEWDRPAGVQPAGDPRQWTVGQLSHVFTAEMRTLMDRTPEVGLTLTPLEVWAVISHLQLALRHPGTTGASSAIVRGVVDRLGQRLALGPGMAEVLRRGWDSANDVPID